MGADLITTYLWYRLSEPEDVTTTVAGAAVTYSQRRPLLDKDAALAAASTLVQGWDTDTLADVVTAHDDAGSDDDDLADLPEDDQRGALEYLLHQHTRELLAPFLDGEDTRDIEGRTFDSGLAFAVTGGLSWGDGPTESYDLWTSLQDDDTWPGGHAVLTAAGFLLDAYEHITYAA